MNTKHIHISLKLLDYIRSSKSFISTLIKSPCVLFEIAMLINSINSKWTIIRINFMKYSFYCRHAMCAVAPCVTRIIYTQTIYEPHLFKTKDSSTRITSSLEEREFRVNSLQPQFFNVKFHFNTRFLIIMHGFNELISYGSIIILLFYVNTTIRVLTHLLDAYLQPFLLANTQTQFL